MEKLCLYSKMQAWLSITPKDSERTNEQIYGGELPDVPFEYGHITQFITDIGTAMHGFDGLVPLTFTEIKAWSDSMKINLTEFESSALRNMSVSYVSVFNNPKSECPIESGTIKDNINQVNASTWASFGTRK